MIRVAINGFGRIGRLAFREMITSKYFDIIAVNSPSDAEEMAYLVKYDSVYKTFHEDEISFEDNNIIIKGTKRIKTFSHLNPEDIPWKDLNIDLVLECSGKFTSTIDMMKHINAGAKKVLLSAPGKDEMKTVVYGVNEDILNEGDIIVSASSCTTNCLAPVLKIINDNIGINKALITTIHAYTSDQNLLDGNHYKGINSRRGRSAVENIVPATTGAAKSIGLIIPDLLGKIDGNSLRVPVSCGSIIDVTIDPKKNTSKEEINEIFKNNENEAIKIIYEPIVSSDIIGKKVGAMVDGLSTEVLEVDNKQLIKVLAWYDNELGYTSQMLRVAQNMFDKQN